MEHTRAISEASAQAKKTGSPYAVIPSGSGYTVRAKHGFFERLPKKSVTVYPSGKVFPPLRGERRVKLNPELLVVRNNPRRKRKLHKNGRNRKRIRSRILRIPGSLRRKRNSRKARSRRGRFGRRFKSKRRSKR